MAPRGDWPPLRVRLRGRLTRSMCRPTFAPTHWRHTYVCDYARRCRGRLSAMWRRVQSAQRRWHSWRSTTSSWSQRLTATRCPTLPLLARALVRVAREAVQCYLPHALSKVCRVDYGVLSERDVAAIGASQTARRIATAVPFTGKDRPSPSAEFAHADVRLVLTALAFRHTGLRRADVMSLVGRLQAQLRVERGAPAVRPAARLFREWQSAANCDAVVPPLQWVDLSCERTVGALCTMLARSDGGRERHLREHVFPLCLRQHARHVSAIGE